MLRYRIYERVQGKWRKSIDDIKTIQLNRGLAKFDFNDFHRIEIIAGRFSNSNVSPLILAYPLNFDFLEFRVMLPL